MSRFVFVFLLLALGCGDDTSVTDGAVDVAGEDADTSVDATLELGEDAVAVMLVATEIRAEVTPAEAYDGTNLRWNVRSGTVDDLDCDGVIDLQTEGLSATLTVPAIGDARCLDELEVNATLTLGERELSASTRVEVTLPEGYGQDWREDPANPILALDTCPTWGCLGHTDPSFFVRPDGSIDVWFSAGGDRGAFPVVGYGVLSDGRVQTPTLVLEPGESADSRPWDFIRETVNVVRHGEGAMMTYLGYATDYFTDPAIGVVFSDDGRTWERSDAPVYTPSRPDGWDAAFISGPMALQGSDGRWRLYYGGASTSSVGGKIGLLISDDGVEWQPHTDNPVFDNRIGEWDESVIDAYVVFVGGRYLMWHTGWVEPLTQEREISIGLAESEDGITWTRVMGTPVVSVGESGAWNDISVVSPSVLVGEDGSLRMIVHGTSTRTPVPAQPEFKPERLGIFHSP